jgi:chromosome segregation ATPase
LLDSTRGEVDEEVQKVAHLKDELADVRHARDTAEAKLLGLADRVADTDQQQEEAEVQCTTLAEELTLMQIRGSELCLAIVSPPKWGLCLRRCGCFGEDAWRVLGVCRATLAP